MNVTDVIFKLYYATQQKKTWPRLVIDELFPFVQLTGTTFVLNELFASRKCFQADESECD